MSLRLSLTICRAVTVTADVITALLAWGLGGYIRFGRLWLPDRELFRAPPAVVIALYILVLLVLLHSFGAYRLGGLRALTMDPPSVIKATAALAVIVYASVAVFKLHGVSRLLLGYVVVLQGLLLLSSRLVFGRLVLAWLRSRSRAHRMLLVGSEPQLTTVAGWIRSHPELGVEVTGCLTEEAVPSSSARSGADGALSVLGDVGTIDRVLREHVIDEVIVTTPLSSTVSQVVLPACRRQGKPIHLVLGGPVWHSARYSLMSFRGVTVLSLSGPSQDLSAMVLKRLLDVMGACTLLAILAPFFLVIALLIKATSPGPVFFTQERVGHNGRRFKILKFRTMAANAEELKGTLHDLNEAEGPLFKIRDDPRVTPVGTFLRRANLDELPQLFNVFKGEMSLVGPRPLITSEARECLEWHKRHSVKPGITGLWQVAAHRHNLDFDRSMQLDMEYVDNWSPSLDLRILLRTILEVVGLRGL